MNYIVGMLLLFMEEEAAFWMLCTIVEVTARTAAPDGSQELSVYLFASFPADSARPDARAWSLGAAAGRVLRRDAFRAAARYPRLYGAGGRAAPETHRTPRRPHPDSGQPHLETVLVLVLCLCWLPAGAAVPTDGKLLTVLRSSRLRTPDLARRRRPAAGGGWRSAWG